MTLPHRRTSLLLTIALLLAAPAASLQAADILRIDGSVVKPGDPLLPNSTGITYKAYATQEGVKLIQQPKAGAATVGSMSFLQGGWVVEVFPPNAARPTAMLLATSDVEGKTVTSALGWVGTQDLLVDNRPLAAAPGIYRKCMIVNRVDQETNDWEVVRLTRGPWTARTDKEGVPVRLNNVFFVYKQSIDAQFVLLGISATFAHRTGPEKAIVGWAPADRVANWNTRFGFEWDIRSLQRKPPRITRGYVYRTIDFAKKFATQPKSGEDFDQAYLFHEEIDAVKNRKVPFYRSDEPRFIVMGRDGESSQDSLREVYGEGQRKLFHAGVIGSTNDENAAYREKVRALRQALRQVQIVFLMDKTEEMEPYLTSSEEKGPSPVHQTVSSILEDYRIRLEEVGDERRELELSLSFYGDVKHSRQPFIMQPLVDIKRSRDLDTQLSVFQQIRGDDGGDSADSLFQGIEGALNLFSRTGTKRRILIILGTMGDRLGDDAEQLNAYCDNITKKAIPPRGMPIEIYPIQAATDSVLAGHADAIRFDEHMTAMAKAVNLEWQKRTNTKDSIATVTLADKQTNRVASLVKKIADRVQAVEKQNSEAIEALRISMLTGELQPESSGDGAITVAGEFLKARMRQNKLSDGAQPDLFAEGYIWQQSFDYDGVLPQVRTVVRVEKGQADNLRTIVRAITEEGAFRVGKQIDLVNLSKRVLDTLTGDTFDQGDSPKNISEYLVRRSLPFQSKFMQGIVEGKPTPLTAGDLQHLLLVKEKLNDIEAYVYREYKWERKKLDSGEILEQWVPIKGTEQQINRIFTIDGDPLQRPYVWLDLGEELP